MLDLECSLDTFFDQVNEIRCYMKVKKKKKKKNGKRKGRGAPHYFKKKKGGVFCVGCFC